MAKYPEPAMEMVTCPDGRPGCGVAHYRRVQTERTPALPEPGDDDPTPTALQRLQEMTR